MKNKFYLATVLFATLLFLSPADSMAQYKSVMLGIKVAPNLGWIKTDQDNYSSDGVAAGFSWGLVSDFYFAENYAFSSGLSFNFQNGKLSYPEIRDGIPGSLDRSYRFKYLEIPALIKMKTKDMNGLKVFGILGAGLSVRLNSKAKDVFTNMSGGKETTDFRLIDSQTNLFKASMIVGAGVEYELISGSYIIAGLTFNNGLTNALKGENTVNRNIDHQGKPNFFELNLAFMF